MTGMPEAALARELDLPYTSVCLVVHPAAGVNTETIDVEAMMAVCRDGAQKMWTLVEALVSLSE